MFNKEVAAKATLKGKLDVYRYIDNVSILYFFYYYFTFSAKFHKSQKIPSSNLSIEKILFYRSGHLCFLMQRFE
jgi:heme oxygenase